MAQIYLTIAQIDKLHQLAHEPHERFGLPVCGAQLDSDTSDRSDVTAVALTEDGDNAFATIDRNGWSSDWTR